MPKGSFTQGLAVLFNTSVALKDLAEVLDDYSIVNQVPASERWEFGGPTLIVAYRPEMNGYVSLDLVNEQWPDSMGDPKAEPMLMGAWATGHFGPYAFPYGLKRATEQSWSWKDAGQAVAGHRAFVRLRLNYSFGASSGNPLLPKAMDPVDELLFLTRMALALLRHPAAICYFNPNGEKVLPHEILADCLAYGEKHDLVPFDVWSNVRLFDLGGDWSMIDSVGNWQLDIPDQEVGFPSGAFAPQHVDGFIRNVSAYVLDKGMVIKDGDTMDGPGSIRWQAKQFEESLVLPPRTVLRWLPVGDYTYPKVFFGEKET